MVAAYTISRPYRFGGWGIKDVRIFNIALILNSLWRSLFGKTLWSSLIQCKYIKMDVFCWIRNPKLSSWNFSPMWWGFMKIFHCFKNDLIWQVGTGELICVGIDPIIGMEDHYTLPSSITRYLQILGLSTLNKIYLCRNGVEDSTKWMSASDLGLSGYLARAWDAYILNLNSVGVRLNQDLDQLVWGGNPASGFVTAKSAYSRIV